MRFREDIAGGKQGAKHVVAGLTVMQRGEHQVDVGQLASYLPMHMHT